MAETMIPMPGMEVEISVQGMQASRFEAIEAAEAARSTAETERESSESARAGAEQARVNSESARRAAESGRKAAEEEREQNEAARAEAESEREAAEELRKETFAGYEDRLTRMDEAIASKADKTAFELANRRLDALWKLNQGISYQFETDATEAYQKTVPSGAKLANIDSIGGKTVVWNQLCDYNLFPGYINGLEVIKTDGNIIIPAMNVSTTVYYNYIASSKITIGHKVYICGCPTGGEVSTFQFYLQKNHRIRDNGNGAIVSIIDENLQPTIRYSVGEFTEQIFKPRVIDLTMLFGAGNEPTSIDDSRIAWIKQYVEEHPEYNAGELVSADIESIKYNDAIIADIHPAVRALPGYGWSSGSVYNSIERTETGWQYVQRVGSVDLGALRWDGPVSGDYTHKIYYVSWTRLPGDIKRTTNFLLAGYKNVGLGDFSTVNAAGDKSVAINGSTGAINIADDSITDFTKIGLFLYEKTEPIISDISDLMGDEMDAIAVEAGGTITFESAAGFAVPNSVEYAVALAEVT